MALYRMEVKVKSFFQPGSGEGWSSLIDSDIVFDGYGLPLLPARRLKGLLRESAMEVKEMSELSGLALFQESDIDALFGTPYQAGLLSIYDFRLKEVAATIPWLEWAFDRYHKIVSAEAVLDAFTTVRQQTAIQDNGIARDNSLRTIRVLNPGRVFSGEVEVRSKEPVFGQVLALACANLRRAGSMRNRGFGFIECTLFAGDKNLTSEVITELQRRGA